MMRQEPVTISSTSLMITGARGMITGRTYWSCAAAPIGHRAEEDRREDRDGAVGDVFIMREAPAELVEPEAAEVFEAAKGERVAPGAALGAGPALAAGSLEAGDGDGEAALAVGGQRGEDQGEVAAKLGLQGGGSYCRHCVIATAAAEVERTL